MSFEAAEPRIVRHMNEDHADALHLYVDAFTDYTAERGIRMIGLDAEGMTLHVPSAKAPVRIPFTPPLTTPDQARERLVALVHEAEATLKDGE